MFEDILNGQSDLPESFQIPLSDLLDRIILKDVSDIGEMIDSFQDCIVDLKNFQQQGYEILISSDRVIFEKS